MRKMLVPIALALAGLFVGPVRAADKQAGPVSWLGTDQQPWSTTRVKEARRQRAAELKRISSHGGSSSFEASLRNERITLDVELVSFRGPNFKIIIANPDGSESDYQAGPIRTRRGRVQQWPGSQFIGSEGTDGLTGVIHRGDGRVYRVLPSHKIDATAAVGETMIVAADDVQLAETHGASEATASANVDGGGAGALPRSGGPIGVPPECDPITPPLMSCDPNLHLCEIGIDTDYIFVGATNGPGNDICETVAHIEFVMNAVNAKYERDLSLRHLVGPVRLRLTEEDTPYPYTNDSDLLLDIMRAEWADDIVEQNLAFVAYFAGRGHDTANAVGGLGAVCSPNAVVLVSAADRLASGFPVWATAGLSHNSALMWGALSCIGSQDACGNPCGQSSCNVMYYRHIQRGDCYLQPDGSGGTIFNDVSYFTDCAIDRITPKFTRSCVFDSANLNRSTRVTANGAVAEDGITFNMTSGSVLVGTPAEATIVYTNESSCDVGVDIQISDFASANWQLLDCGSCQTTVAPGASLSMRVAVNSNWPGAHLNTLRLTLTGPIKSRVFRLPLRYETHTPVGVPPGPFSLTTPIDGAVLLQGSNTCIDLSWTHSQYVERYEVVLLRKFLSVTDTPGFQVLFNDQIRYADSYRERTCADAPADGSPLEYIWGVRAINAYGDRIAVYHPYGFHFPQGFGLYEPFIPSLTVNIPTGGSTCGEPGPCKSDFERNPAGQYGDLNFDGCVDQNDLQILVSHIGQTHLIGYRDGDLDFDGDVDQSDAEILETIGLSCPCGQFSGCGRVTEVTQGGCYVFTSDCDGAEFAIENIGSYAIGANIWVRGTLRSSGHICFPAPTLLHLPDNEVGKCVTLRGKLVSQAGCTLLQSTPWGELYELEFLGNFGPGDNVEVTGGIVTGVVPECSGPRHVVHGNTITGISTGGEFSEETGG